MISRGLSPPFFKLQPIGILYSHSIVFIRRYLPHFFELLSVYHIDVQRHTCASCVYICLFANVYIHLSTYRFLFLFLSGEDPQSCSFGFWTTCDLSVLNSSGKCVGSSKIEVCHPFFFGLLLSNFPLLSYSYSCAWWKRPAPKHRIHAGVGVYGIHFWVLNSVILWGNPANLSGLQQICMTHTY